MDSVTHFFSHNQKLLTTAASFALVIAMSATLANAVVFVIELENQAEVSSSNTNTTRQPARALDINPIKNLFGSFQATVSQQTIDAPKTTLNLELQGIFTAENPADSTAIVAQRGQAGELYRIGDRLPGNATLEAVYDDHILIKRGARTEKLPFADSLIGAGFSQTSTPNSTTQNASLTRSLSTPAQTGTSRLEQVRERIARRSQEIAQQRSAPRGQPANDLREAISQFQDRLEKEPAAVMDELGVQAVETDSGSGYRISGELAQSQLRQAGLQEGDVVLSVNGQRAAAVANDRQLMDQVMQSDRVRVEVQRDDRRFFVTVPVPK